VIFAFNVRHLYLFGVGAKIGHRSLFASSLAFSSSEANIKYTDLSAGGNLSTYSAENPYR